MGKKTFLGVFDKSLKKQLREKRQNLKEIIEIDQGLDTLQKDDPKPIESYNTAELTVRCLGHNCEYVSYKNVDGITAL
jgi:hypothetical protein